MRATKLVVFAIMAAAITLTFMAGGASLAARSNPVVKLQTSMGDIEVELYPDKAPKTVDNFLAYVNKGFYNGTVFHRVINGFMVQGGGLNDKMQLKATGSPIENEADNGLTNDEYTLAMARTMDPHSATAQFFINVADNEFLNFKAKNRPGLGLRRIRQSHQGHGRGGQDQGRGDHHQGYAPGRAGDPGGDRKGGSGPGVASWPRVRLKTSGGGSPRPTPPG